MADIDHLVYVVPDLKSAIDHMESELGVRPQPGGHHLGVGTWNALLGLRSEAAPSYLELIAPDPEQDSPNRARPFGIDDDPGPRLATYAIRPSTDETLDDLVKVFGAHDLDPGDILPMSRITPAGDMLAWRLTMPTETAGGLVPFLIDWGDTPMPSTTIPVTVELEHVGGGRLPPMVATLYDALRLPGFVFDVANPEIFTATLRNGERTLQLQSTS